MHEEEKTSNSFNINQSQSIDRNDWSDEAIKKHFNLFPSSPNLILSTRTEVKIDKSIERQLNDHVDALQKSRFLRVRHHRPERIEQGLKHHPEELSHCCAE